MIKDVHGLPTTNIITHHPRRLLPSTHNSSILGITIHLLRHLRAPTRSSGQHSTSFKRAEHQISLSKLLSVVIGRVPWISNASVHCPLHTKTNFRLLSTLQEQITSILHEWGGRRVWSDQTGRRSNLATGNGTIALMQHRCRMRELVEWVFNRQVRMSALAACRLTHYFRYW